jgi:hypothetical protein
LSCIFGLEFQLNKLGCSGTPCRGAIGVGNGTRGCACRIRGQAYPWLISCCRLRGALLDYLFYWIICFIGLFALLDYLFYWIICFIGLFVLLDYLLLKRRKPQRDKEHKGMEVLSIFVPASEEEIKKMDNRLGSTERVFNPSF